LLSFSVEGRPIGETVVLAGNGGTVEVEALVESILPIHALEIVERGRVVASTAEPKGARKLHLRAKVKIDGHTWLAARVGGPGYVPVPHFDSGRRGIFAHTSPVYVACGGDWHLYSRESAQYMLTLIEGALTHVREGAAQYAPETVTHHHADEDHLAHLERPFLEAREALLRRVQRYQ
jgi:hypothetical protein